MPRAGSSVCGTDGVALPTDTLGGGVPGLWAPSGVGAVVFVEAHGSVGSEVKGRRVNRS